MDFLNGHFRFLHSFLSLLITLTLHQVCKASLPNQCDLSKGSWVPENSEQLYDQISCPFIRQDFNCLKNGRENTTFLNYKWQPNDCSLPRFDGKDFIIRFGGKNILFVGDSLSLNQFQSLTCMVHAAVPDSDYTYEEKKPLYLFKIPEHRISITFRWNVFLVDLDTEKIGRVLKLDSIKNADLWRGADVLIFNTWHHWVYPRHHEFDYIQLGNKIFDDMDRLNAFEIGLNTWARWIDSNINPQETKVFFQGISASHLDGREWNQSRAANCDNENEPISGSMYPAGDPQALGVVKKVLETSSNQVDFLDITLLSQLRKDGHPSIYGSPSHTSSDCTHWCLPGVPDTWNQILYAALTS